MPEMKHAISGLTYGQTEELGVYRQWIEPPYGDRCWLGVRSERIDGDILSRDGLAKSPGKVVLTIEKVSGKNIMLDTFLGEPVDSFVVTVYVTNVHIDRVAVTGIDTPVTGQPLDFTADCDTVGVKSVSVYWYNLSDKKTVSKGEVAQARKTYRVDVDLLPQAGYQFVGDKSEAVTINGEEAYIFGGTTDDLSVSYTFSETAAGKPVITKQPAAASGQVGSPMTFSVTATGATGYNWYIYDVGDAQAYSWSSIKQHATVSGESTSKITITPTDTWLNGRVLDCTIKGSGGFAYTDQAKMTVTAAPKTISTVTVTGIDAPVIGAKPDTNAVVSTGMTAGRVTWSPADPVFNEGVAYTVTVTVLEEDGYTFGSAVTATINGQTAKYSRTRQAAKLFVSTVSYTFPALKSGEISNVAVTGIDAPVFGKTPDNTAVVPADAQYTVAAVSWDPACDSFLGNSVYNVLVSLESKDGMKFAATPAVTINGEAAKVVSGAGSEELKISYTFPKTPAAYDLITNTYSTTDVTASLKEYVAVSVYTDLPDMAKNIKYQWYKTASNNYGTGTAISGATAAGYAIPTDAEGTAYYYCIVTASVDGKNVTSESSDSPLVKVTVKKGLPAITTQPKSVSIKEGADVTFSVAATGEALNYQWYQEKGGSAAKVGTNGPTYTIKAVNMPDDNGTVYYCVVSNKAGEVTSDKTTLTVSKLGTMTAFSDVPEGAYYTDAVAWAVEKGVTSGTSAITFSPNATCTRAQTVTFLWRSQKSPADGTANSFTDVAEGTYYTDAVKWAVKNSITSGTSATTFSPNADCSRAQIVTFLYRCLGK